MYRKLGFIFSFTLFFNFLPLFSAQAIYYPDGYSKDVKDSFVVRVFTFSYLTGGLTSSCSGSLIKPDVVLTAAHCLEIEPNNGLFVEVLNTENNILNYDKVPEQIYGKRYIIHQRYSKERLINDIGLVLLDRPSLYGKPVQLTKPREEALNNFKNFTLLGYGLNQNNEYSPGLAVAEIANLSSQSGKFFNEFNYKSMLGAGKYREGERVYTGACLGDSGGALIAKFMSKRYLVGVTSFGGEDCNFKAPTVFMKVSSFYDWIIKSEKELRN